MRPDDAGDDTALERRMTAVASVRQVVNAIWALGRAQLPHVEAAALEVRTYAEEVEAVVARLAGPPEATPSSARTLRVVFGPERGWCGTLARELMSQLPPTGELGLVGRRLGAVAEEDEAVRARVRFSLPGAGSPDDAAHVARAVAEAVLQHLDAAQVELWHPVNAGRQLHQTVLLGGPRARRHRAPATLSPWSEVLRAALIDAVTSRLAVGAVEALRSEVHARVLAADQARAATDRQLERLQRAWQVARQERITTELLEVVAGRAAMLTR